jgi:PAS domain S-box-containing protein
MNTPKPQIALTGQLAKTQTTLDKFFTLSLDLFCIRCHEGYFKQLNPAWENLLGWTDLEMRSQPWFSFVHPDDREASVNAERQCYKRNVVEYENRYRHKDGSYRWLSWRVSQDEQGHFYGVAKDITTAKHSEQALHQRLEFESLITTLSTEFIRLSSEEIDEGINHVLRVIGEFSGFDYSYVVLFSEDYSEGNLAYAWSAEIDESARQPWQRFSTKPFSWGMEKLWRLEAIQVSTLTDLPAEAVNTKLAMQSSGAKSIVLVPMLQGKSLIGYVGFASTKEEKTWSDDTLALLRIVGEIFASALNRKQAESKLRESERRFRAVFNQTFQLSSLLTLDGKVLEDNQTAMDVCQLERSEVIGHPFWELTCWTISPETQERLREAISQAAAGNVVRYETDILAPDNSVVTIDFLLKPLLDETGQVELLIAEGRDLTERKRAEAALRESEERWQLALRGNNDSIWDLNLKTNQCFHSARWREILGYEEHEVSNYWDDWGTRVHPDDLERAIQARQDHLQGKTPYYIAEYRIRCKDGNYKWILSRAQVLWDESGNPIRLVGSHTDISDRKQAEVALQHVLSQLERRVEERTAELKQANEQLQAEIAERQQTEAALRQSEEQFRRVFDESPIGMGLTSLDGRFFRVNQAWLDMLGYTESELNAVGCADITHPEDWKQTIPVLEQIRKGEINNFQREQRFFKKNQEILWGNLTSIVLRDRAGEIMYGLGMVEDISERKQTETALLQSEEQFRRVFDQAPIGMGLETLDERFIRVNRAFCNMLGYTESELMALNCAHITHPEDWEQEIPYVEQIKKGEIDSFKLEKRYLKKNQEILWVNLTVLVLRDQTREILYALAMVEDITERKQALEALQQSEARYRAIIEDQTELICRFKPDGTLTFVNNAYCRYFHQQCSELIGKRFMPVIPKEDQELVTQYWSSLSEAQPIVTYEHQVILPSGEIHWQQWTNRAMFDEQGNLIEYQAVGRDITPLKQAETEILKALEKERELNELRSGFVSLVSHEFRTPLTTIQSSVQLLERYSDKLSEEKKQTHLTRIQTAVSRMILLLEDILTIGKAEAGKLQLEPSLMDVVAFCGEIVDSMQMSARSQHTIDFVVQGDASNALMDEKLLGHIITNLLSNAIKYSPSGGTVRFDLICTESSVVFRVQDSGIGIPQEDLETLFESFQRASNVGGIPGTGLGLAIVKRCVDLHGGQIAVESEVGVGTTFTVTLPLHSAA